MSDWLSLRARSEQQYRDAMPERGYLNTATNAHFQTIENGKIIFYPQSTYGRRGFVVSSPEQEMLLRRNVREYQSGHSILCFIMVLAFGSFFRQLDFWQHAIWIVGFVVADWAIARAYYWRFTRWMEPSDIPNSPVAFWHSMGVTMPPMLLVLQTVYIACLAGACLYFLVELRRPILLLLGGLMIAGLVPNAFALKSWWRTRSMK
ncbi:hypothetical protein ACFLSZ_02405 [Candidatus Bipolaricaulota bacterium]